VRELRHTVQRAVLLCTGDAITAAHFTDDPRPSLLSASPSDAGATDDRREALRRELAELERQRIVDALERCAGNQTRAAQLLGMPRRTLVAKLAAHGVPRPRKP
jgi:DNA-binding NtrC family response regulator